MRITAAIVAVEERREHARKLLSTMPWPTTICFDSFDLGCSRNHVRAWGKLEHDVRAMRWLQRDSWCLVVEDDAVPVEFFDVHAVNALEFAPADVVSLYLGTGRPVQWQERAERGVRAGRPWIVTSKLLHAVAVAVRAPLVSDMLDVVSSAVRECSTPIDEAITQWLVRDARPVAYTNPSLVDHADGESFADHSRDHKGTRVPRKAWRTTGASVTDWTDQSFAVV